MLSGRSFDWDLLPLPAPVNAVSSAISGILLDALLSVAVGVITCQNLGAASSNPVQTRQDTMDVDCVLGM